MYALQIWNINRFSERPCEHAQRAFFLGFRKTRLLESVDFLEAKRCKRSQEQGILMALNSFAFDNKFAIIQLEKKSKQT